MHGNQNIEGAPIPDYQRPGLAGAVLGGLAAAASIKLGVDIVSENRPEIIGDIAFSVLTALGAYALWPRRSEQ